MIPWYCKKHFFFHFFCSAEHFFCSAYWPVFSSTPYAHMVWLLTFQALHPYSRQSKEKKWKGSRKGLYLYKRNKAFLEILSLHLCQGQCHTLATNWNEGRKVMNFFKSFKFTTILNLQKHLQSCTVSFHIHTHQSSLLLTLFLVW